MPFLDLALLAENMDLTHCLFYKNNQKYIVYTIAFAICYCIHDLNLCKTLQGSPSIAFGIPRNTDKDLITFHRCTLAEFIVRTLLYFANLFCNTEFGPISNVELPSR